MTQWTVRSHNLGRTNIRLEKPLMTLKREIQREKKKKKVCGLQSWPCGAQPFVQVAQAESGLRFPALLLRSASGSPITGAAGQLGCPPLPAAFPAAPQAEDGAALFLEQRFPQRLLKQAPSHRVPQPCTQLLLLSTQPSPPEHRMHERRHMS